MERPHKLLFLCGGAASPDYSKPSSLRQLLIPPARPAAHFRGYDLLLAENAANAFANSSFSNLLEHEEAICAIADGIILIVESPGSLCELGAFVKIENIRPKLLIIMQGKFLDGASFVTKGAIKYYEECTGRQPLGYEWQINDGVVHCEDNVIDLIINDILEEMNDIKRPLSSKFDESNEEHLIYLTLSICFLLRAPLIGEIEEAANLMNVRLTQSKVKKILEVLTFSKLLRTHHQGKQKFYVATTARPNVKLGFKDSSAGKLSWSRIAEGVRSEFETHDKHRLEIFKKYNEY